MVDCCETLVTVLWFSLVQPPHWPSLNKFCCYFFFLNPCSVLSGVVQCFLSVSHLDFDADIDLDLKAMISNVLHSTLFISNISFEEWCKMKGKNKGGKKDKKKRMLPGLGPLTFRFVFIVQSMWSGEVLYPSEFIWLLFILVLLISCPVLPTCKLTSLQTLF